MNKNITIIASILILMSTSRSFAQDLNISGGYRISALICANGLPLERIE